MEEGHGALSDVKPSPSKASREPGRCAVCRHAVVTAVATLVACLGGVQYGRAGYGTAETELVITKFKTRGTDDKGAIKWELEGAEATVRGGKAQIRHVKVTFSPTEREKQTQMTSPHCAFDRETRIVSSDAPLHVQSAGFVLDGIGYDILTDRQKLFIRNKVRMIIRTPEKTLQQISELAPARTTGKQSPRPDEKDDQP